MVLPWVAASVSTPMMLRPSTVCPSLAIMTSASNLAIVWTSSAAARAWSPSLFLISRFLLTLSTSLVHVAVLHVNAERLRGEPALHLFHQHDGTVAPPGAAERDRQAAFSFLDVIGQRELQQRV